MIAPSFIPCCRLSPRPQNLIVDPGLACCCACCQTTAVAAGHLDACQAPKRESSFQCDKLTRINSAMRHDDARAAASPQSTTRIMGRDTAVGPPPDGG